jgi:hypothetical protein
VLTTTVGTPYESHNLRRDFRRVTAAAGLGSRWVPKEMRTSFVSMMSYQGVPVEEIARLAGHASSRTTEVIYRRELRPVITTGAEVMDQIFRPRPGQEAAAGVVGLLLSCCTLWLRQCGTRRGPGHSRACPHSDGRGASPAA